MTGTKVIPRYTVMPPIQNFLVVSASDVTDAFNLLVDDVNVNFGPVLYTGTGVATFPSYPIAALPAGYEGQSAFATNGRKIGEAAGAGTGVPVYFSHGIWRVFSTDAPVTS